MQKQFRYHIEAFFVKGLFDILKALPIDVASNVGGWLGRAVGPWLKVHTIARENLSLCIPGLTAKEQRQILTEMWDNLGRTAAEFPHLPKFMGEEFKARIEVEGLEQVEALKAYEAIGKPVILFSGHFANWEINALTAHVLGVSLGVIYRPANNPIVEDMIQTVRSHFQRFSIPKSGKGMKKLVQAVKSTMPIAMLMDQKANEGIDISFFGRPAKTAPAIATLALKYQCEVIPVQVIRIGREARFKVVINSPMVIARTGNEEQDVEHLLRTINGTIEQWIREYPSQWFWVHRRWGKH